MKDITRHSKVKPSIKVIAPNHSIIYTAYGTYFTSYNSVIVFLPKDESTIYLGEDWKSSTTTSKHRRSFIDYTTKELDAMLLTGKAKML